METQPRPAGKHPRTVENVPAPRSSLGQPFRDTLVALEVDQRRDRTRWALVLIGLLGTAWGLWGFLARVDIYAVSQTARIERQEVQPLSAASSGRLVWTRLELGRQVQAGELLAELDQGVEREELEEATRRHAAIEPRIRALRSELQRELTLAEHEVRAAQGGIDAARSRMEEAQAAAQFASIRADRTEGAGEAYSAMERMRLDAEAHQRRSQLSVAEAELRRQRDEFLVKQSSTRARIDRLTQELAELEGAASTAAAAVEVSRQKVERRKVYATQAGTVVWAAPLQAGASVKEGDRLATVVASGGLRIVAHVAPHEAVGRIREGQVGTMRLAGFPWAQFGTVRGRVTKVAAEPSDGAIRVELALEDAHDSAIPFQHGLEGTVEISVDQMAPVRLFAMMLGDAIRPARGSAP